MNPVGNTQEIWGKSLRIMAILKARTCLNYLLRCNLHLATSTLSASARMVISPSKRLGSGFKVLRGLGFWAGLGAWGAEFRVQGPGMS